MRTIIFLMVLFFCVPAFSQTVASTTRTDTGWSHKVCDVQTANGICDGIGDGTGEDTYAWVGNYSTFNVNFSQVGSGATCDVYAVDIDVPMIADMSGYSWLRINSVSLSSAQTQIGFAGAFENLWIECSTIGTSVTVTVRGAVGLHRDKR